ncbi:MAG TPA: PAS domain S-box protein, partial [Chloroflexota bacterium]
SGQRESYEVEKRYMHKNQQILWGFLTASLVRNEQGEPEFVACMVQDITVNKSAGVALQDIEQLYRQTFEHAAIGVAHTDSDGRFRSVNRRLCEMLQRESTELLGRSIRNLAHPDDAEATAESLRRVLSGEVEEFSGEQRYVRKDGSVMWTNVTTSVVRLPDGEPKYGIVMIEDITEQKQAREALRESEERFRAITETAHDAIITLDSDSTILFVNPATSAIFGYSEDELEGKPFATLLPPSLQGTPQANAGFYVRPSWQGSSSTTELTGLHRDGHEIPIELTVAVSTQQQMYTAVVRDISGRKRAEQERADLIKHQEEARAMTEAAATIRGVVQASPLPIITLDPEGKVGSWNEAATDLFGWTEDEVVGGMVPFALDGQESESVEFRERAMRGESITNLEIRRQARDGSLMDMYMSTAPVRDSRGSISGIMYVYADITDRKRAEKELQHQRDFALQVMGTMGQGLAITDSEGKFDYVNPAYAQMLGVDAESLIGRSPYDFTVADDHYVL